MRRLEEDLRRLLSKPESAWPGRELDDVAVAEPTNKFNRCESSSGLIISKGPV